MDIQTIRQQIDAIDRQMVALLKQRMEAARQVAQYKKEHQLPVLDSGREQAVLDRVGEMAGPTLAPYVKTLYAEIFRASRDYQQGFLDERARGKNAQA